MNNRTQIGERRPERLLTVRTDYATDSPTLKIERGGLTYIFHVIDGILQEAWDRPVIGCRGDYKAIRVT